MQSADSIASNGGVLTKIYVPPQVFAISSALAGLTNFFIGMLPLALVCFVSGQPLAWTLPLVLVVGIALALLTAGLGLALSIMFIRFDDTRNIVNVLLMILMYLTPIFYPVSVMNSTMQSIIHWNPLTSYLDIFRWAFSNNATPTLFNAGTPKPQMSSCFLLQVKDDSIDGIYDTLKMCAKISQSAGGIGINIHNVRATGSYIKGTNGTSNGIIPMLKVYNETASYVDQGGGKRKGSIAVYLEPWHNDIFDFIELRKQGGDESDKCRDLFLALWIPDKFMNAVYNNEKWYLMSEDECPNLSTTYGQDGTGQIGLKYKIAL
jgi:hypothetical protein